MLSAEQADAAPPSISCTIRVPKAVELGQPVPLTMVLRNRGTIALAVLNWGTPFEEGWFQPFVSVTRDGRPVPFAGAMVKRTDPEADEYLRLEPRAPQEATLDLALAFDLSRPGRYVITPKVVLHDVVPLPAPVPRPRTRHQRVEVGCSNATLIIPTQPRGQSR